MNKIPFLWLSGWRGVRRDRHLRQRAGCVRPIRYSPGVLVFNLIINSTLASI